MASRFPGYTSRVNPGGALAVVGESAVVDDRSVKLGPASRALLEVGRQEQRLADAERAQRQRIGGLQARKDLLAGEAELEENPDYEQHAELHRQRADAIDNSALEFFGEDQAGYKLWKADFDLAREKSEVRVRTKALRKRNDAYRANLDVSLEDYAAAAISAPDAEDSSRAVDEGMLSILEARQQGVISDADAVLLTRKLQSDVDEGQVRESIRIDPAGTLAALEDGAYENITGKDRTLIMELAQNRVWAAEARARARAGTARSAFAGKTKDHITKIQMTGTGIPGFREEVKAVSTPEQYQAFVEQEAIAGTVHAAHERFRTATPVESAAIVEEYRPGETVGEGYAQQAQLYATLGKMRAEELKRREQDPAGAMMHVDAVADQFEDVETGTPEFTNALTTRMRAQAESGVMPNAVRVLTGPETTALKNEIENASDALRGAVILDIQRRYGEHSNQVLQELGQAGLGPGHKLLSLVADDPVLSERVATAVSMDTSELKQGLETGDVTDMRRRLGQHLADFEGAVLASGATGARQREINELRAAMEKTGMAALRRGASTREAAEDAANVILDRHFVEDTWYSPAVIDGQPIDGDRVSDALEDKQSRQLLEAFDPLPPGSSDPDRTPEELQAETINVALREGFWTTSPDGTKLRLNVPLVNGGSLEIVNRQGEFYEFLIRELSATGGSDRTSFPGGVLPE